MLPMPSVVVAKKHGLYFFVITINNLLLRYRILGSSLCNVKKTSFFKTTEYSVMKSGLVAAAKKKSFLCLKFQSMSKRQTSKFPATYK